MEKKQMRLKTFCAEFDVPYTTAIEWVHSHGFPAYKLGKGWYIDIPDYYKWRRTMHINSYKYA